MFKAIPLILILVASAFGQASIADLQAKAKASKLKDLVIQYDKFKDKSYISTKPQNLVGGMESFAIAVAESGPYGRRTPSGYPTVLLMQLGFGFKGDSLKETQNEFLFSFASSSTGWVFLKGDKNLYILYDNDRLELKPVGSDADISFSSYGGVSEFLGYEISRETVEKLLAAKKLEFKLGDTFPRKWKSDWTKRIQALLALTKIDAK